ncbi:MAG: cyclic nucleotide-binding domain-containing protein [Nitrospirota bacterium]
MTDQLNKLRECMINEHSVFSFLCEENLSELAGYFQTKTIKAGELIWEEGGPCDYAGIIISGRVEIKKKTEFEGKYVVVGIYNRGAAVGVLCFLNSSARAVTAVALEDVTLMVITPDNFDKLLTTKPDLGIRILKGMLLSVSIRLKKSYERLAKFF